MQVSRALADIQSMGVVHRNVDATTIVLRKLPHPEDKEELCAMLSEFDDSVDYTDRRQERFANYAQEKAKVNSRATVALKAAESDQNAIGGTAHFGIEILRNFWKFSNSENFAKFVNNFLRNFQLALNFL